MSQLEGVGRVGWRPTPPQYLLDGFPGAALAFSMRRLNSAYNGPVIRVRRSSDNAEMDINFDPTTGYVSRTEIINFCTNSTGYITTVYDQSGNDNHLVQPIASYQAYTYTNNGYVNYNDGWIEMRSSPIGVGGALKKPIIGGFNLTNTIMSGNNWTSFALQSGVGDFSALTTNSGYSGGIMSSHMFYGQLFTDNGRVRKWYDGTSTNSGPFYGQNILITTTNINDEINSMINNSVMNPPYRSYSTYTPTTTSRTFTKWGLSNSNSNSTFEFILYTTDKSAIQADVRTKILEYYPIY
jgi:hypothetical protein